jgi:hypothetical protein
MPYKDDPMRSHPIYVRAGAECWRGTDSERFDQLYSERNMTVGGWITMIFSLTLVWFGTFWCFWKVLTTPETEKAPPGFGP